MGRNGVNQSSGKNKFFGTGETFLFKLQPIVAYYPWVGAQDNVKMSNGFATSNKRQSNSNLAAIAESAGSTNANSQENGGSNGSLVNNNLAIKSVPANCQMFMCGEPKYICIGSGDGNALWLDENLSRGRSERCLTFDNEPLVEKCDFICGNVELIGFR